MVAAGCPAGKSEGRPAAGKAISNSECRMSNVELSSRGRTGFGGHEGNSLLRPLFGLRMAAQMLLALLHAARQIVAQRFQLKFLCDGLDAQAGTLAGE